MSEIATTNASNAITSASDNADWLTVMTTNRDYFKRIQLNGGSSKAVKKGLAKVNTYSYVETEDELIDLGDNVDVFVCALRPKALDMREERVKSYFNPHAKEFKECVAIAQSGSMTGCMYGPDALLWIPSIGKFAIFMLANKTAQSESQKLKAAIGKWATLTNRIITADVKDKNTGKFVEQTWNGPVVTVSSVEGKAPDEEEFKNAMIRFQNEKSSVSAEAAPPPATEGVGS